MQSHPARGVWIETLWSLLSLQNDSCRTPHGVCGLKQSVEVGENGSLSRTPHGVCGLKLSNQQTSQGAAQVAPRTGCVD